MAAGGEHPMRKKKKKKPKTIFQTGEAEAFPAPTLPSHQTGPESRPGNRAAPSSGSERLDGMVESSSVAIQPGRKRRKKSVPTLAETVHTSANIVPKLRGTKRNKRLVEAQMGMSPVRFEAGSMAVEAVGSVLTSGAKKKKRRARGIPASGESTDLAMSTSAHECAKQELPQVVVQGGNAKSKTKDALPDCVVAHDVSADVATLLRELSDPKARGTLSDRLNSTHSCFDKHLKKRWKSFTKKERALLVDCDKNKLAKAFEATSGIKHPFTVVEDDHCETALEAYRDISPILSLLARSLWKKTENLQIYDPFYCAGAVVNHLAELGFKDVYNKCEDFYAVVREGRVPEHDVVVTNPPYSEDHVERLLRWCRSNGKPFLLLMPNYFAGKPYYEDALGGTEAAKSMLYLFPWKRYMYWTPKGLRAKAKVQGHVSAAGNRTSPFVSFWYLDLAPTVTPRNLLKWWSSGAGGSPAAWAAKLCKIDKLPPAAWEDC